jgi:hypothetical protein
MRAVEGFVRDPKKFSIQASAFIPFHDEPSIEKASSRKSRFADGQSSFLRNRHRCNSIRRTIISAGQPLRSQEMAALLRCRLRSLLDLVFALSRDPKIAKIFDRDGVS